MTRAAVTGCHANRVPDRVAYRVLDGHLHSFGCPPGTNRLAYTVTPLIWQYTAGSMRKSSRNNDKTILQSGIGSYSWSMKYRSVSSHISSCLYRVTLTTVYNYKFTTIKIIFISGTRVVSGSKKLPGQLITRVHDGSPTTHDKARTDVAAECRHDMRPSVHSVSGADNKLGLTMA